MDEVKIEGGILDESIVFKQENTADTHQEIVEIGVEDIKTEDDYVAEENGEFGDQCNIETYSFPQEFAVLIKGQNVAYQKNVKLESNDELEGGVMAMEENEESDFISSPLDCETNYGINTSFSNPTIGERNEHKSNESTKQTIPKKQLPVMEKSPVVKKEKGLLKFVTRKRDDKRDLYDNQAVNTITDCSKKNPTRGNKEAVCSNSNSLLFSWLNREGSNSKNTCSQETEKATVKAKSRKKAAKQGKSKQDKRHKQKSTEIYNKSKSEDVSKQNKTINDASEQELYKSGGDSVDCENLFATGPGCSQPVEKTRRTSTNLHIKEAHPTEDLSPKHTSSSEQKLNITTNNIKGCISVKESKNNVENTNNKLLKEEKENRRDQNIVESRNSNIDVSQSKGTLEKVSSVEQIKKSDPFDCDDDDDIFGNEWEKESCNDYQVEETEIDGTKEESTEMYINNSSWQEGNTVQGIQLPGSKLYSQDVNRILDHHANSSVYRPYKCESVKMSDIKYRCSHCQEVITGEKEMEKHIRQNHRKKSECQYCQREFCNLKRHMQLVHSDENDINYLKCDLCDYKAKTKVHLRRHITYKHTKREEMMDRMLKCDQCPKMYKLGKDLIRHKHTHEEKRTEYRCANCNFKSFAKEALVVHMEGHMNPETLKTQKCPHCDFTTPYRRNYRIHLNKHVEKIFQCDKCSYRAKNVHHLNLHLISHKKVKDEKDWKYKCDKCDYKTYRHYNFQIHKLKHLEPGEIQYFYCYHCQFKAKRKDNLKSHIQRHFKQEQIPFQCFICDFTTKIRSLLISHIDKHSKEQWE